MLVIRLQRTGRKGHAQFRVVVQDSRRTPTSGKIVAPLGSYNPHTKTATIDKEKAIFYMEHGAQPSERVARLLAAEGVKLPTWVKQTTAKAGKLRHPEKLRRNQPAEEKVEEPAVKEAAPVAEAPEAEAPAEETPAEKPAAEPEVAEADSPINEDKKA